MSLNGNGESLCKLGEDPAALTLPVFVYLAVYTRGLMSLLWPLSASSLKFMPAEPRHGRSANKTMSWLICLHSHGVPADVILPFCPPWDCSQYKQSQRP